MSRAFPAFVDGQIRAAGESAISIDDLGFLHGIAVFDTLRVADGVRLCERLHRARLERDARALAIAWPPPWDPARAWDALQARLEMRTFALRTTLTRGPVDGPGSGRPSLVVQAREIEELPRAGVRVALERELSLSGDALERIKTTSRVRWALARERARAQGAFDALFVDEHDHVLDGTIANVWALVQGRLVTPPAERGALPGIVRAILLEELASERIPHAVATLPLGDLARAEEVFLTNSVQRVIPVADIAGLRSDLPGGSGRAAQAALELVRAREARERT